MKNYSEANRAEREEKELTLMMHRNHESQALEKMNLGRKRNLRLRKGHF